MAFTLTETIDLNKLKAVCNNPYILQQDVCRYVEFYKELLPTNGVINVTYEKHLSNGVPTGRYYPKREGLSSVYMWGAVRSELFNETDYDIDLENCHPTLLLNICKANSIICKHLSRYVNNRDDFIDDLNIIDNDIDYFNEIKHECVTKKDIGKQFFTSMMYGGSISGKSSIKERYSLSETLIKKKTGDAVSLVKEIKTIIESVISLPQYAYLIENTKKRCEKQKKKSYHNGTGLSAILQEAESKIILDAINFFKSNDCVVTVYIYDGFQVQKSDKVPALLKQFNDKYDNKIKLIIKPFKTPLSQLTFDTPIRNNNQISQDWELYSAKSLKDAIKSGTCLIEDSGSEDEQNDYKSVKKRFESQITKIINKAFYIKKTDSGNIIFSRKDLVTAYENWWFVVTTADGEPVTTDDGEPVQMPFLKRWFCDKYNNSKDDIGVYPNHSKCPQNIYNMWTKFAMEHNRPYSRKLESLQLFRNHLKLICNHNDEVFNYMENWIAHSYQCPDEKSICPVLISQEEGTGKTLFVQLLGATYGSKRMLITTDPSRDVWGTFNGAMASAYLVNPNEISKKDSIQFVGKIKGLITDNTLMINEKGKGQFEIQNYSRFIITTNRPDPITSQNGDRRFLIIECSAEMKGNIEYFRALFDMLNDKDALKTIFDYYNDPQNFDAKNFSKIPMPITDYQQVIKETNKSVEESWLEQYVTDNYDKSIDNQIETQSSQHYFKDFQSYLSKIGLKSYETNAIKFGMALSLNKTYRKDIETKKFSTHNSRVINITSIAKKLGLDTLEDDVPEPPLCLI